MGYLSNKKFEARINNFLKISIITAFVVTLFAFAHNALAEFLGEYRWQLYLILTAIFIYALYRRFFVYALLFFVCATINYFAVSSIINPLNEASADNPDFRLLFASGRLPLYKLADIIQKDDSDIVAVFNSDSSDYELKSFFRSDYELLRPNQGDKSHFLLSKKPSQLSGRIYLSPDNYAGFVKIKPENLMFIALDFTKLNRRQISSSLQKLTDFVARQDDPVVIYGNFNQVSWSAEMSEFITKNNLKVKNSLSGNLLNIFFPPHYYILGYEHINVTAKRVFPRLNSLSIFTRF